MLLFLFLFRVILLFICLFSYIKIYIVWIFHMKNCCLFNMLTGFYKSILFSWHRKNNILIVIRCLNKYINFRDLNPPRPPDIVYRFFSKPSSDGLFPLIPYFVLYKSWHIYASMYVQYLNCTLNREYYWGQYVY